MSANTKAPGVFSSTIPKQHGAWSILIVCYILGTFVGGRFGLPGIVLLIALAFAYIARHAWNVFFRSSKKGGRKIGVLKWSIIYSLIVLGSGAYIVFIGGLWEIFGLGLIALFLVVMTLALSTHGKEFTATGEIIGIWGLTLAAPAAEYVASGNLSVQTLGIYILCSFFFSGSVYHVRYLVRNKKESQGPPRMRFRAGYRSLVYHLFALALIALLSTSIPLLPPLALVAFIPVTVKALWTVAHRYEKPLQVRQIGYREVAHTMIFAFLAGLAYHLG